MLSAIEIRLPLASALANNALGLRRWSYTSGLLWRRESIWYRLVLALLCGPRGLDGETPSELAPPVPAKNAECRALCEGPADEGSLVASSSGIGSGLLRASRPTLLRTLTLRRGRGLAAVAISG